MMKVWQPSANEIEKTKDWGIWEKEVSEFTWTYDNIETCYILEGSAAVIAENGSKVVFKQGDMVQFEKGLNCTWNIIEPIKKRYKFG